MKYMVLVSHGMLAPGLRTTLDMFGSKDREDIIAESLTDGMDAPVYVENLKKKLEVIKPEEDEIILMGDLLGGSPLTNAINVINDMGMMEKTLIIAGMNLPSAVNALFNKDAMDLADLGDAILEEADVKKVVFDLSDDEDEDL